MRVVTWNVRGSAPTFDGDAVATFVDAIGADAAFIQEIQRRQAAAVRRRLGWPSPVWSFKHWPLIHRAEGMAVFSRGGVALRHVFSPTSPSRWWSWRRRIIQVVEVGDPPVVAVHVHLSPHVPAWRAAESKVLAADPRTAPATLMVGDVNARADAPEIERLRATGFTVVDGGWIDHVLVRHPVRGIVVPSDAPVISDHQPVVYDVSFPPA